MSVIIRVCDNMGNIIKIINKSREKFLQVLNDTFGLIPGTELSYNGLSVTVKGSIYSKNVADPFAVLNSASEYRIVEVRGDLQFLSFSLVETLEGCPDVVCGRLILDRCSKLYSLAGVSKTVHTLVLNGTPIKRLSGVKSCKYLEVSSCELETLEGIPNDVISLDASSNRLTKLPELNREMYKLDLAYNRLKSLQGCPRKVTSDFYCNDNVLETLKYAPIVVEGKFDCSSNPLKEVGCTIISASVFNFSRTSMPKSEVEANLKNYNSLIWDNNSPLVDNDWLHKMKMLY